MTAAVEADRLHRFYHDGDEEVFALQGVSLVVEPGEVVAVTGPSGSGKSTLLACLAGLDDPDGGTVVVAGRRVSRRPEAERAAVRAHLIGVLSQSGNLVEHLTVAQNIRLAQRIARSAGNPARHTPPDALLESVGLAGRGGARPSELSGGELARAGLAVALSNDPAVLLADEPTGELDTATEEQVLDLLRDRAGAGTAIVLATHSPAVAAMADHGLRLEDGRAVA